MQLLDAVPTEVDVESLMLRIRASAGGGAGAGLFGAASVANHAKREAVLTQLTDIERHAALVGTFVPPFERFGRAKRKLARFVARAVLYLGRVITAPQRQVNFGLLQALRSTLACLKEEEAARLELQARVQLLERTMQSLRSRHEHAEDGPATDPRTHTLRR